MTMSVRTIGRPPPRRSAHRRRPPSLLASAGGGGPAQRAARVAWPPPWGEGRPLPPLLRRPRPPVGVARHPSPGRRAGVPNSGERTGRGEPVGRRPLPPPLFPPCSPPLCGKCFFLLSCVPLPASLPAVSFFFLFFLVSSASPPWPWLSPRLPARSRILALRRIRLDLWDGVPVGRGYSYFFSFASAGWSLFGNPTTQPLYAVPYLPAAVGPLAPFQALAATVDRNRPGGFPSRGSTNLTTSPPSHPSSNTLAVTCY